MVNDILLSVCRIAGMIFAGWAMLMLAEVAKNGAVYTEGEAWSLQQSLAVPAVLIVLGFLLAFGGTEP